VELQVGNAETAALRVTESARVLMLPMLAFLAAIFDVIVVVLVRSHPAAVVGTAQPVRVSEALGVIVTLKAFAADCSALTGIEAIANGVPPSARRAQRTELMLGALSRAARSVTGPPGPPGHRPMLNAVPSLGRPGPQSLCQRLASGHFAR
jgi:hypothetical protein